MTPNLQRPHSFPSLLRSDCRLVDPDSCYELLTAACSDLDESQGHQLHAMLVLLLINHIGDPEALRSAIPIARRALDVPGNPSR